MEDLMESELAKSDYAKKHGLDTPEKLLEAMVAVVISESDKTPEDVLAIMSVTCNRIDLFPNWSDKGNNPLDQLFAHDDQNVYQYEAIIKDIYGNDNMDDPRYERYMPSKNEGGIDAINEELASSQNACKVQYTYEELRDAVYDAYFGGLRNNTYSFYGSTWTHDRSPRPFEIEQRGGNGYNNNTKDAIETERLKEINRQLESPQIHQVDSNFSNSSRTVIKFNFDNNPSTSQL